MRKTKRHCSGATKNLLQSSYIRAVFQTIHSQPIAALQLNMVWLQTVKMGWCPEVFNRILYSSMRVNVFRCDRKLTLLSRLIPSRHCSELLQRNNFIRNKGMQVDEHNWSTTINTEGQANTYYMSCNTGHLSRSFTLSSCPSTTGCVSMVLRRFEIKHPILWLYSFCLHSKFPIWGKLQEVTMN